MMARFNAPEPEIFSSPTSHYRMRAEFRIWHEGDDLFHIMFNKETKSVFVLTSFLLPAN